MVYSRGVMHDVELRGEKIQDAVEITVERI
jgi:hypothetical protein